MYPNTSISIDNLQAKIRFFASSAKLYHYFFSRAGALHRNNRYRMRSLLPYLFSAKNLSPQNGGFIRAFCNLVGPRLLRQGSWECELFFFKLQSLRKNFISRLKMEKKFCKEENPIPVHGFYLRKEIVLNRIYIFNVVVQVKTKHERSRQTQTQ
jgi:hypothetical protein